MSDYEALCKHEWVAVNVRKSTGENLLGKEITAKVEDLKCDKCGAESLKVLTFDKRFVKEEV